MVNIKTYKNGLRLCHEKNDKNVIAINILFNVGSQNESENEQGYSHFIEHLLFKSSEKYSTIDIMDKLSYYGADFNAYTSRTVTRYIFKCLKEYFEPCFEIYSDMILNPKFDPEEIDKERNVVVEEMKKCDDDPVEVLYRTVMENYYHGNSYAHDELGTEKNIMTVSRDQLLDDIWGIDFTGDPRTVDSHVARLRTKLGLWGETYLKTVYGAGYKIEVKQDWKRIIPNSDSAA